jgi:AcrR family transcriptional regulator
MGIPERKEREKEHRKEAIIDAAEKVFFKKGLPATTMDEIAEAAELSKGTLYLYYKSKEDLYLAVAMRGEEIMYEMFTKATSTDEPVLKLISNLGDAYYEFFKQHREYFRMFQFIENPKFHKQVSPEMLEACAQNDQKIWKVVAGLLQRGIDEGFFEPDLDPIQASIILWSSGSSLMRQMDREDDYWKEKMQIDLEATMRKAYQYILEGMLRDDIKSQAKGLMQFSKEKS